MRLLELPKGPVSEHPLEFNKLRGPKHYYSFHERTFMLIFH